MDFFLFLLTVGTLFVRPAEIFPSLAGLPLYEFSILACFAAAFPKVLTQISSRSLAERPMTACILGVLLAVALSHLSHLYIYGARTSAFEFFKVVLLYLLFVAVVDTTPRLRHFLLWLLVFIAVVAGIALAQYHGYIEIINLTQVTTRVVDQATGELVALDRMRSTGIFNDPNDLAMIIVVGMAIAAYGLFDDRWGALRVGFAPLLLMFGYALALTHSRGGMLALLVGGGAWLYARHGWRRAVFVGSLMAPVALALFAGRQTDFSGAIEEGTGMSRIQLWSEGLALFRQAPLFGIGYGEFHEEVGHVAHNSFVHCFAELGFFGGSLFLGAFFVAGHGLWRLHTENRPLDPELSRMQPAMLAIMAAYGAAMLTLSRSYVPPTYLMLGLAAVYLEQAAVRMPWVLPRVDQRLMQRVAFASVGYIGATYLFVKVFVRWS